MELNTLTEIAKTYATLTEADIVRSARRMGVIEKSDLPIGVVHSQAARRMWALADHYSSQVIESGRKSRYEANSDEEAKELEHRCAYYHGMEELVRDFFWLEVKQDLNAWGHATVGMRTGWMLVAVIDENPVRKLLESLRAIKLGTIEPEE